MRRSLLHRPRQGFTLLEVLAAVLIFTMVMTVLIGSSSETVNRVRLAATRLEANALAERELAKLEAILASQAKPPEDREDVLDDFVVRIYSEPALDDLGGSGSPGGSAPSGDSLAALAGGGSGAMGLGPVLALEAPGIDQFLRRYEIRVEWLDGVVERGLGRTTYAFDWEGAREALPDLFGMTSEGAEGAGADGSGSQALPGGAEALIEQFRRQQ